MDDKTAAIPSLKDFKDKKASNNGKNGGKTKGKPQAKRPLSQDTMRLENIKSGTSKQRSTQGGNAKKPAPQRNSSRSSSAPSSYARDRMGNGNQSKSRSSDYDSSRRVDRSAQAKRRENVASASKKPQPQTRQQKVSSYYDDVPVNRKPAQSRNPGNNTGQRTPATRNSQERATQHRTSRSGSASNKTSERQKSSSSARKPQTRRPALKKEKKPLTERGRKMRKIMLFTVFGLIMALLLLILSLTVFFKAKTIEVKGIDRYTKNEIITASGITDDDNIFSLNKKRAEERIEKIYPYVEDADVRAVFPSKIVIDLKMAEPACKINAIGGVHIVSDKGKVLEVTDNADNVDVPVIEGIQVKGRAEGEFVDYGSDVLTRALGEVFDAFSEFGCTKINEVNIITKGDISKGDGFELRYVYDNRIVVYMGIPEEVSYKIQVADKIIKKLHENEGTAVVGELDVSTCHDENARSYFNPYSILSPDTTAPATTTQELSEEPTAVYEY